MNPHDTPKAPKTEAPKTFLVGTLADTEKFLNCCPTASSLLCTELETGLDAIIAIPCRRWGCRHCGQRKAFGLAIRCELAKPDRFITLTVNPALWETPRHAFDGTRRKLADFAKLLRKQLKTFDYLRVLEVTKKGWPHYHFLARCPYVQQRELSRIWATMTGAPIVDVRRVDKGVNVFKYVLKYLCKQAYVPWTTRRVSWSKSFFPRPEPRENRQNPFVNRRRSRLHPADAILSAYPDQTITVKRPGVWVVEDKQTIISNERLPELEYREWQNRNGTSPSLNCNTPKNSSSKSLFE